MALAELRHNSRTGKWEAVYQETVLIRSNTKEYVVAKIESGQCNKAKNLGVDGFVNAETMEPLSQAATQERHRVSVNDRFNFYENFIEMTLSQTIHSLIVTGEGGLGKTHTLKEKLNEHNLTDVRSYPEAVKLALEELYAEEGGMNTMPGDYIFIKGHSTAKALYRALYENNGKLIIFDDCDRVLKDDNAIGILKGALDSYDDRLICWNAEMKLDDNLPKAFEFEGQVIFLSNMNQYQMDQALKSRSMRVDISMTPSEKIERMGAILETLDLGVTVTKKQRKEALEFLDKHKNEATDLNIRTLKNVLSIVASFPNDWEAQALYTLTA